MTKKKLIEEVTNWLWSLLVAFVMALCFALLYWIFYTYPELHEGAKNFFGSAGTGHLAPPKAAMITFVGIILLGTPLTRLFFAVLVLMEDKKR